MSKNDKYIRVEKEKPKNEQTPENEIRVTAVKGMRSYISYAISLFTAKEGKPAQEKIFLKAMGRAINKTVTIAEIVKRRIPDLHQNTSLESTEIVDKYEPLEEGLDTVEIKRRVSSITITLSSAPLDTKSPGYQPPISADLVKPEERGGYGFQRPRFRDNRGFRDRRGGNDRRRGGNNYLSYQGERTGQNFREGGNFGPRRGGFRQGYQGERRSGNFRGGNFRGGNFRGGNFRGYNRGGNFRRGPRGYQQGGYQGGQQGGYQGGQQGGYQGGQQGYQGQQGGYQGGQQGGYQGGQQGYQGQQGGYQGQQQGGYQGGQQGSYQSRRGRRY